MNIQNQKYEKLKEKENSQNQISLNSNENKNKIIVDIKDLSTNKIEGYLIFYLIRTR